MNEKNELRKKYLQQRKSLDQSEVIEKSKQIVSLLTTLQQIKEAQCICGYSAIFGEPNLHNFYESWLNMGRSLSFMKTDHETMLPHLISSLNELVKSEHLGIHEPHDNTEKIENFAHIDVILVPGVVFDCFGHRIGFGKGYYDKFLKKTTATRIGIAYDFQVINQVPRDDHDCKLDYLVTPSHIFTF